MKCRKTEIISNRKIAAGTYEMVLAHDGSRLLPGQFINIRLDEFFLRRPISICDWNENTLTIIYKTVGRGTDAMSRYAAGRELDILIPLGNGYDISRGGIGKRPIVIGGGAGVPPMFGLCRRLKEKGLDPVAVLGFKSSEEMFYIDKFRKLGVQVAVATEDGSYGAEGFVTDVLSNLEGTSFFACGPEAMLKAVDSVVDRKLCGWLSFEERMGCGFGACMGCSCETKYGSKRICKDGPVLEREEIIW